MGSARNSTRALLSLAMTSLLLPATGLAQDRAGVVTTLQGTATVVRASAPDPTPLKFKDDVFARDRIATGEKSFVRVLLGGKATVTAREHTVLTVTEVPGTATIDVASGRIAVAVSKDRMKPGEVVQITTPNVIAAIRGTVVIAEVSGGRSVITVLRGLIDVTRIDPAGRTIGQPVNVSVHETISVSGASALPLPRPTTISPEKAKGLSVDFTVLPKNPPAASVAPVVADSLARAAQDLAAVLPKRQGGSDGANHGGGPSHQGGNGGGNGNAPAVNVPALGDGAAPVVAAPGNGGSAPGLALGNGDTPGRGGGHDSAPGRNGAGLRPGNPGRADNPGNGKGK